VLAFAPDGGRSLDQILLRRKEFVVRGDDGRAEALGREVDEVDKRSRHRSRPACALTSWFLSHTRSPRTKVVCTRPWSRRPAYGVSLWRCCRLDSSTTKLASGSHTTRSASKPVAMRPLLAPSPARAAARPLIPKASEHGSTGNLA